MKKMILFIGFLLLTGITLQAQRSNLNSLPKAKRDSILKVVAKETMLKYAPEWFDKSLVPTVEYFGYCKSGIPEEKHRQLYDVFYYVDKDKMPYGWSFWARVTIWEDTGKATILMFGPMWGISNLDNPTEELEQIPFPENIKKPF